LVLHQVAVTTLHYSNGYIANVIEATKYFNSLFL
jgi:hypothetical protein